GDRRPAPAAQRRHHAGGRTHRRVPRPQPPHRRPQPGGLPRRSPRHPDEPGPAHQRRLAAVRPGVRRPDLPVEHGEVHPARAPPDLPAPLRHAARRPTAHAAPSGGTPRAGAGSAAPRNRAGPAARPTFAVRLPPRFSPLTARRCSCLPDGVPLYGSPPRPNFSSARGGCRFTKGTRGRGEGMKTNTRVNGRPRRRLWLTAGLAAGAVGLLGAAGLAVVWGRGWQTAQPDAP